MVKVFFSPAAEKDFERFPRSAREEIKDCLVDIGNNLRAGKQLHGPLRGFFVYRFRADGTPYRIAYEIAHGDAIILMIGSRDNFYKKFSRRVR